ncbi:MAG: hypothetical protein ABSG51_00885 [Terracidiphilus sp.]|jgi:hypothetical protein
MPDEKPNSKDRPRRSKGQPTERPVLMYPTVEKDPPPKFIEICWPLVGGLILAFVAPMIQSDLMFAPRWLMWLVFPFVMLTGRRDLGIPEPFTILLPTAILYLQFPLEGLLTFFSLTRRAPVAVALAPAFFIHAGGFFILIMLSIYIK